MQANRKQSLSKLEVTPEMVTFTKLDVKGNTVLSTGMMPHRVQSALGSSYVATLQCFFTYFVCHLCEQGKNAGWVACTLEATEQMKVSYVEVLCWEILCWICVIISLQEVMENYSCNTIAQHRQKEKEKMKTQQWCFGMVYFAHWGDQLTNMWDAPK